MLDLGSGDGHLLGLVLAARPGAGGVALDFSPAMLERLNGRFAGSDRVAVIAHDLEWPLPPLGVFDAMISSFSIHHVSHTRRHTLYAEVFDALAPGGAFCSLEHCHRPPSGCTTHSWRH